MKNSVNPNPNNSKTRGIKGPVNCTCRAQLQTAKEVMKAGFKTKYEARLKALKTEFEDKFRKNEQTWRSRLEFHK
jgi:uncharacterized membrane protein YkoI